MSMYNGPYGFEFIGACVRWLFIVIFSSKKRNQKGLFKEILKDNSTLKERPIDNFFLNVLVGITFIIIVVVGAIFIKLAYFSN